MRGIFNWGSDPKTKALKEKLDKVREEAHTQKQELSNQLATENARKTAKLEWFDKNADTIRDKYMELNQAFSNGDKREATRIIYGLRDLETAVLRMAVLDGEGNKTSFAEWMGSAFAEEEKTGGIISKARTALEEKQIAPAFEDIKETVNIPKPDYSEIDDGFIAKIKGDYEDEVRLEISNVERTRQLNNDIRIDIRQAITAADTEISIQVMKIAEEMLVVTALIRLDAAMEAAPATAAKAMNNYMPFLAEKYGLKKITDRLLSADEDGTSPLMGVLKKSDLDYSSEDHPLQAFLAVIPSELERANTILALADMAGNKAMEKALKSYAIEKMGAYVRPTELSLFVPSQMGFVQDKGDKIRFACLGKNTELYVSGDKIAPAVVDFLSYQPGFDREGDNDQITNRNSIYYSRYAVEDGTHKLYSGYFGSDWHRTYDDSAEDPAKEKAYAKLDGRAKSDERFVQAPDRSVIDKTKVDHAWVAKDENGSYSVKYITAGQKVTVSDIESSAAATELLSDLAGGGDSIQLTAIETVRPAAIGNAWIADEDGDRCKFKFVIDAKSYYADMDTEEAYAKLDSLKKQHGFITLKKGDIINPAQISLLYYDNETDKLNYVIGGKSFGTKMTEKQSEKVLGQVLRKFSYVQHQDLAALNPDLLGRVFYREKDKKLVFVIGAENWSSTVTPEAKAEVLKDLADRDNYIALAGETYLNRDMAGVLRYDSSEGRLEYTINGESGRWTRMERDSAVAILDAVEEHGRTIARDALELEYEGVDLDSYEPDFAEEEPKIEEAVAEEPEEEPEATDSTEEDDNDSKWGGLPDIFEYGPK